MRVGKEFPALSEDRDVVSTGIRAFDLRRQRFIDVPRGCVVASRRGWILLCRGAVTDGFPTSIDALRDGHRTHFTGSPVRRGSDGRIHGHWRYVMVSPDRKRLLAQWSGECEIPTAFVVERGRARPFGASSYAKAPESLALGWLSNGSAVVHFPVGACGGTRRAPGVYVVPMTGKPRLVVKVSRLGRVAMWGG